MSGWRPRRSLAAAFPSLVLVGLFLAAGFAASPSPVAQPDAAPSAETGTPRAGDVAAYGVRTGAGPERDDHRFARHAAELVPDAVGNPRYVLPLVVQRDQEARTVYVDAETGLDLAVRTSILDAAAQPLLEASGLPLHRRSELIATATTYIHEHAAQTLAPCTARLQTQHVSGHAWRLFEPCTLLSQDLSTRVFALADQGSLADFPATLWVTDDREPVVHVWTSPRLSYPLRIEVAPQSPHPITVRLTHYATGTGVLDAPPNPAARAHDLEWRPLGRGHPLDDDAHLPFRLDDAYTALTKDLLLGEWNAFRNAHEGEFLSGATYEEAAADGAIRMQWTLQFTDGRDGAAFCVTRIVRAADSYDAYRDALDRRLDAKNLQSGAAGRDYVNVEARGCAWDGRAVPLPDPATPVPTPASLLQRLHAYAPAPDANEPHHAVWGFRYVCADPACGQSVVRFHVGHQTTQAHLGPTRVPFDQPATRVERVSSVLHVGPDGRAAAYERASESVEPIALGDRVHAAPDDPFHATALDHDDPQGWNLTPWHWVLGGSLLASLGAIGRWFASHAAAARLHTRLRRDRLLEHPLRHEIHEIVRQQPGIHQRQLQRLLDRGTGVVLHHIHTLVKANLLVVARSRGRSAYFLPGVLDRARQHAAPVLATPRTRRVLRLLMGRPQGVNMTQLAREADVTRQAIAWHLERLADVGLVARGAPASTYAWRATPLARDALDGGAAPG